MSIMFKVQGPEFVHTEPGSLVCSREKCSGRKPEGEEFERYNDMKTSK